MNVVRFTLLADGSSDRRLLPVIHWTLRQSSSLSFVGTWAEFSSVRSRPSGLRARTRLAAELYPCDLLFVHRDAERATIAERAFEIADAVAGLGAQRTVAVVTVRMQEAWFLFDESAIRTAAANPYGAVSLSLPRMRGVENIPDPKLVLHNLLKTASGLHGRGLRRFDVKAATYRVADLIDDYSPLRQLHAFRAFEANVAQALGDMNGAAR